MKHAMFMVFGMVLGLSGGRLSAQDLDVYVSSFASQGRIKVVGLEPEWVPRISMWSERALERLERDWRLRFPFDKKLPLEIRIEGEQGVKLFQAIQNNRLRQRILLPGSLEDASVDEMSDVLVAAMLTRLRWSAGIQLPARPPSETVAWSAGAAVGLLPERAARLAGQALLDYEHLTPPSPELVRKEQEVDSFLLYRWVQDTMLGSPETAGVFWNRLVRNPDFGVQDWIEVTPGVRNLRDLHQAWDVWWQAEKHVLISEYGLENYARAWLIEELNPVPRYFGLDAEDAPSLAPATLTEFAPYLEHPRFFSAMSQWILRLQRVRYRQPKVMNEQVQRFEQALEMATRAIQGNGRITERYFDDAAQMWRDALELTP